jgi:four helix bundle protein
MIILSDGANSMCESVLKTKSYAFALRIVRLSQHLSKKNCEYVIGRQILRCGTAIGALVYEAEYAESKLDFIHKLHISLKEANETDYWLSLLKDSGYISEKAYQSMKTDIDQLLAILIASIKTAKIKLNKEKLKENSDK